MRVRLFMVYRSGQLSQVRIWTMLYFTGVNYDGRLSNNFAFDFNLQIKMVVIPNFEFVIIAVQTSCSTRKFKTLKCVLEYEI